MLERVCHLWDHPVSSACISRNYVSQTLQNVQIHQNQDKIMVSAQNPCVCVCVCVCVSVSVSVSE